MRDFLVLASVVVTVVLHILSRPYRSSQSHTHPAQGCSTPHICIRIYIHMISKKNTFRIPIPIHYPITSTSTASATFFFLGIIRVGVALSLDIRHSRRHRFIIRPQSSLSFSPNLFLESCPVILLYNRLTTNLAFFVAHHCAMVTCL